MLNFKNKKIIYLLGLGLFLNLIFFQFAEAEGGCDCGWNIVCWIMCGVNYIANVIIGAVLLIIASIIVFIFAILGFFAVLGAQIAEGISAQFLTFSLYASTGYLGSFMGIWKAVRNFTLWFFAVFLAFIGLATIFRIETYGAKRTLVPLLIIALLLNFIPFFVKTIVNIGNSLTCILLRELPTLVGGGEKVSCNENGATLKLISGDVYNQATGAVGDFLRGIIEMWFKAGQIISDPTNFIKDAALIMIGSLAFFIFWIMLALAFIIIALIFLVRTVFIWLLFLAAPIAFATFPFRTKEIKAVFPGPLNWEGWWEQILEWSFVGIPVAFWLAIACLLLVHNPFKDVSLSIPAEGDLGKSISNMIQPTLVYLPALVALYLGITTTPGMMGGFAKGLIGGTMGIFGALGAGATAAVAAGAVSARKGLGWVGKQIEKRSPRLAKFGRGVRKIGQRLEEIVPARMVAKETLKGIPFAKEITEKMEGIKKAEAQRLKAVEGEYKRMPTKELEEEVLSPLTSPTYKKAALKELIVGRGKLNELIAEKFFKDKSLDDIEREYGGEVVKELKTKRPDLLKYVKNPKTGKAYEMKEIADEFLPKMSPKDLMNLSDDALKHREIAGWVAERPAFASVLVRRGKESQKIAFYEGFLQNLDRETETWGVPLTLYETYKKLKEEEKLSAREALRKAINENWSPLKTFVKDLKKTNKEKAEAYKRLVDSIMLNK